MHTQQRTPLRSVEAVGERSTAAYSLSQASCVMQHESLSESYHMTYNVCMSITITASESATLIPSQRWRRILSVDGLPQPATAAMRLARSGIRSTDEGGGKRKASKQLERESGSMRVARGALEERVGT